MAPLGTHLRASALLPPCLEFPLPRYPICIDRSRIQVSVQMSCHQGATSDCPDENSIGVSPSFSFLSTFYSSDILPHPTLLCLAVSGLTQ